MYLLMRTGFAVTSACVAAYVIFLLGIAGEGWEQTVQERIVLTLIGGLLAMLSYALFPAWETPKLRDRLAEWLEANGRYALAVFDLYARPAERRPRQVRESLLDARAARVAWEESEARAEKEPVRHRGLSRTAATAAGSALATMGRVTMILEAHLPAKDAEPSPGADAFAAALRPALETRGPRGPRAGGAGLERAARRMGGVERRDEAKASPCAPPTCSSMPSTTSPVPCPAGRAAATVRRGRAGAAPEAAASRRADAECERRSPPAWSRVQEPFGAASSLDNCPQLPPFVTPWSRLDDEAPNSRTQRPDPTADRPPRNRGRLIARQ